MPVLYCILDIGGVSSINLSYFIDYIYHGEVNLIQEQLDGFLESAQKLDIEGLIGPEGMIEQDEETYNDNNDNMQTMMLLRLM